MYWNLEHSPIFCMGGWRLIETWDVLKSLTITNSTPVFWLIETWDVLKLLLPAPFCPKTLGLIETWDVLK